MKNRTIIDVKDLRIFFYTNKRCNKAIDGVSFEVKEGRTLCIVGESGCGKSVTASAILQLLPRLSRVESGSITYHGHTVPIRIDQQKKNGAVMRSIRGQQISMIFQDPMTALNPVYTVGYQIAENIIQHRSISRSDARKAAVQLLADMGIPLPDERVDDYPHQFSGGMRQRAMIAMAMSCDPLVLIADEPTTALDVTIQAQIFDLIEKLKQDHGTAVILITHDMGVVTEMADDVVVMYMGNVVERGSVRDVLQNPVHPYTRALLSSVPVLGRGKDQDLEPIRGSTPDPYDRPPGCQFAPRCDYATDICRTMPPETAVTETHGTRCWHWKEVTAMSKSNES